MRLRPLNTSLLILLLLHTLSHNINAQNLVTPYSQYWKLVESQVNKNLPASALEEVRKIYQMAKKENNQGQLIKATVYMANLQSENRENNAVLSIAELENELAVSSEPTKSILTNLLATSYYRYFENNRWQLYQRTQTTDFKKDDIATWGLADFHDKISKLYLLSLKNEELLKQTKLETYDAIITKGNLRKRRPTLYDLLAFKALTYFSSNERDIKKPAYAFEINSASAFDPAADFIHRKFETKDSSSLEYKALIIYQKLIAFHANDKEPDALIDADISRLQFVKEKSVHPDADQLYFMSMNHLAEQYASTPAAAQAWYLTGLWHEELGRKYDVHADTSNRLGRQKASTIFKKVVKENPDTEGGANAYNILHIIEEKSFQFQVEKVNVPDMPFRVFVEYTNTDKLFFRLVKATDKLKADRENDRNNTFRSLLTNAPAVRNWQQALTVTKDHQKHAVEIKVDPLPVGEYYLVASTKENFSDSDSKVGSMLFHVSNISYLNRGNDYFVLNRTSGQPLAGAKVQFWNQIYNNKTYKYSLQKGDVHLTDKNGYFKKAEEPNSRGSQNFRLEVSHKKDRLFNDEVMYNYYNHSAVNPTEESRIFVFTDRSIYRPGQTVYYKGIVAGKDKVLADQEFSIVLQNANGEEVSKLWAKANEYGTFSGKFQLPQAALNGQFTILVAQKHHFSFRVEEYKRPKFYVDYEPVKTTYQVNDSIKVNGNANAYAGNTITVATVKYRVVRTPRFLYPWLMKRGYFPQQSPMEITHGEVTTDANGKFSITFLAIPDLTIDKKLDPIFNYTVYADVTDSNGETRSAEKSVSVSYKSILLKLDLPATLTADSLKTLNIRPENTNGEFAPAHVSVKVNKLKAEQRLIRSRYWARPDQFLMTKAEYIKNFPFDKYDNETDPTTWAVEKTVYEKSDSVIAGKKFSIDHKLAPGFYQIEILTKDKNGEEVKLLTNIDLTDPNSKQLTNTKYLWSEGSRPIEPGQKTTVQLGSSADNLFVVHGVSTKANDPNAKYSFFKLNNEKRSFEFTAKEEDRGGFGLTYTFVKHNRTYQFNDIVDVPWTNKDLKIEYATFRDKTQPGSDEKWTIKISGYKKEKVAAEMLASMYDASLDQFYEHNWNKPELWSTYNKVNPWNSNSNFGNKFGNQFPIKSFIYKTFDKIYDQLIEPASLYPRFQFRGRANMKMETLASPAPADFARDELALKEAVVAGYGTQLEVKKDEEATEGAQPDPTAIIKAPQIRKNFNETAFWLPDLRTNETGEIEFSFTMPEALTRWKFQALAHTKELAFGYSSKEIVTQKDLMVQPNAPRFLREGDKIEFSSKIANLTDKALTGTVTFQLFDTETNLPIDDLFGNSVKNLPFTVQPKQSTAVQFPVSVPKNFSKMVTWRITAKAGSVSDGEENILPVLPNRMLVTESMPLTMRGTDSKSFKFEKLINSGKSATLTNHALTVEYTSNPVWYAVQALPYLMEYPYDCAEQTWNRYYANALAANIANSSPRIAKVFENWRTADTTALLSNLQKNEELKSVLLEETPWVLEGKSEAEQKRNIALLFDLVKMGREMNVNLEKVKQMQSSNGGFVWFKGGPDDRYMTQYIVSGIGHLQKLKAVNKDQSAALKQILDKAIPYLDLKIKNDYEELIRNKANSKDYTPGSVAIQYLYMRSFFPDYKIADASQKAVEFFTESSRKTWTKQNKYMQGMIALASHRAKDAITPKAILKSLGETAIRNEEMGMYWKSAQSWWWHDNPIERQALMIEAFQEAGNDTKTVDDLRTWLLKNKQTNRWESTKATAEACYALLLQGTEWLSASPEASIQLGKTTVKSTDEKQQAGTGYFKKTIEAKDVTPEMGNIKVNLSKAEKGKLTTSWGAVYWQYFEDLDKITFAETPLKIEKKLFIEKNSDTGPVLTPVENNNVLRVGDKIKVRIVLRVDRDMEYVHMKDMRASSLEPVNVLSSYKWQGGLGYYESTKDAATNFFFSSLQKGTYVFEYPLFVTHEGNFSNGITTVQCMYAPEFTAHSEGVRIEVK
jgi:uncharacterized protein YfaS (alpha-2-macroglobulin family)